jgi:hypothetical protein
MRPLLALSLWLGCWAAAPALAQDAAEPAAPAPGAAIGYPSVAAALDGLHAKPGVAFRTQDGWTIAEDQAELTFWSFPPPGHPAYPSAVKRQLVKSGDDLQLEMNVACEAPKEACEALVSRYQRLNQQMIQSMRAGR